MATLEPGDMDRVKSLRMGGDDGLFNISFVVCVE
jgi:hypothetical protein